jgi:mRNA-degrading endonuclease YafQ of YafQ-DinJ toxin-antitoxin module
MRTVRYTKRFQRDYKREQSSIHSRRLDALLMEVVDLQLANDAPLPPRNRDHALSENGVIAGIAICGPIWC